MVFFAVRLTRFRKKKASRLPLVSSRISKNSLLTGWASLVAVKPRIIGALFSCSSASLRKASSSFCWNSRRKLTTLSLTQQIKSSLFFICVMYLACSLQVKQFFSSFMHSLPDIVIAFGAYSVSLGISLQSSLVITLFLSAGKCFSLQGRTSMFFFSSSAHWARSLRGVILIWSTKDSLNVQIKPSEQESSLMTRITGKGLCTVSRNLMCSGVIADGPSPLKMSPRGTLILSVNSFRSCSNWLSLLVSSAVRNFIKVQAQSSLKCLFSGLLTPKRQNCPLRCSSISSKSSLLKRRQKFKFDLQEEQNLAMRSVTSTPLLSSEHLSENTDSSSSSFLEVLLISTFGSEPSLELRMQNDSLCSTGIFLIVLMLSANFSELELHFQLELFSTCASLGQELLIDIRLADQVCSFKSGVTNSAIETMPFGTCQEFTIEICFYSTFYPKNFCSASSDLPFGSTFSTFSYLWGYISFFYTLFCVTEKTDFVSGFFSRLALNEEFKEG